MYHLDDLSARLLHVGREVGVTADDCCHNFGVGPQSPLQAQTRTNDALSDLGFIVGSLIWIC